MMATSRFVMCANSGTANTIGSIPSTWRLASIHLVAGLETAVAPLFLSFPSGASPDDSAIRQANSSSRSVVWEHRMSNVCRNVSCHKHPVKPNSLDQVRVKWITIDIFQTVRSVQRHVSCHKHPVKPNSLDQVRCVSIGLPPTYSKLFAVCNATSPATSIQSNRTVWIKCVSIGLPHHSTTQHTLVWRRYAKGQACLAISCTGCLKKDFVVLLKKR